MQRVLLVLWLAWWLVGCGAGERAEDRRAVATPPEITPVLVVREPPQQARTVAATPRPSAEESLPARRRDVARLRDARRLVRAGEHADALVIFDSILARPEPQPRVRCEAGYVAFRAGDLDRAERDLDLGRAAFPPLDRLAPSQRVPLAMCLYNRGLVHERRGETIDAATILRASLHLRANASVEAALRRVGADPALPFEPQAPADARPSAWPERLEGASIDALLASHAERVCDAIEASTFNPYFEERVGCATARVELPRSVPGTAVIAFQEMGRDDPGVTAYYLAIEEPGHVLALGPIATTESPSWYFAQLELRDVERQGDRIVLELTLDSSDTEEGCTDEWKGRTAVLCDRLASGWVCASLGAGALSVSSCIEEEDGADSTQTEEQPGWGVRVAFAPDGRVHLRLAPAGDRTFDLAHLARRCPPGGAACDYESWTE